MIDERTAPVVRGTYLDAPDVAHARYAPRPI